MIFDLQPPSPSLSPNSKTRFYQEQLDKAHEIIDQLEILLQEKEHQKRFNQTTYKNIEIPILQFNKKSEKSQSYVTTPLQYSTPRDRRTILSFGGQTSTKFLEEMKSRHSELILQYQEDNTQREQKNKELNDQIQELKSELIFCKQSITKKEKKSTEQKLEILENQIQNIQMQLLLSKEKGENLQTKIIEINQTNNILEEQENNNIQQYNQDIEQQLKQDISRSQIEQKFQNKNSHKKLLGSLQKEIKQLENKKQEFKNQVITTIFQFEEKQIQCKEYNDRQNLVNDIHQNQNIVISSESGALLNTYTEEDINSIKSIRNRKNRNCESCQIF